MLPFSYKMRMNNAVSNEKKKLLNSGQICRKDTDCSENDILVHAFFFVRLLVYEVWSSLMYVSMQKT